MVSVPVTESKDHIALFPHVPDVLAAANTVVGNSVIISANTKNRLHILFFIFFLLKICDIVRVDKALIFVLYILSCITGVDG